jgi:osmoprotectant transport system permease protein
MKRTDVKPRAEVIAEMAPWLTANYRVKLVGELGFENAYALAMPRKRAEELGIRSIADLARHAPDLTGAGDYEFFSRPEWAAIRDTYGIKFREQRTMQPEFMYAAAGAGEVDVISAYTSDGLIAKYDLVVLEDPRHAIPPYDAILLVSPRRSDDAAFIAALQPLIGAIDVASMREANFRASSGAGSMTPDETAKWLWEKVQKKSGS